MGSPVTITPDTVPNPQVTITPDTGPEQTAAPPPASFGQRFLEGAGLPTQVPKAPQNFKELAQAAVAPATEAYQKAKAPIEHAEKLLDALKKGDGATAAKHLGNFLDSFIPGTGNAMQLSQETLQDVGEGNVSGAAGTATGLATRAALVKGVTTSIPSAARAGAALEDVKAAAGTVPIDVGKVGDTALKILEESESGATLPPVVRKFIQRATKPGSAPITYAEAKQFQSNVSQLSAEERMALKPNTQRLLGKLNGDLKSSLQDAADTVGKGEQFAKAMKEYHSALKLKGFTDTAIAAAWKGILGGLGLYGVKKVIESALP